MMLSSQQLDELTQPDAFARVGAEVLERVREHLTSTLGPEAVSLNPTVLRQHGQDESFRPPVAPDLVVYPRSTSDVVAIMRTCSSEAVPVVPFGAGTSLEGHVAALAGGVCVDLSRMREIRNVSAEDLEATVEPGVTRLALERVLGQQGLMFPVDPGADATLGGMVATGASGTMSLRYGTMREAVLSLEVVLPRGEIVRTRSRARKSSAGYDLTRLFVGSEGTLGVITEIVLKVEPIAEAIAVAVATFPDLGRAVECVMTSIHHGLRLARSELLDEAAVTAVNRRAGTELRAMPTVFAEFHATAETVGADMDAFEALACEHGAVEIDSTTDPSRRAMLWRGRHDAYPAAIALRPGGRGIPSDVCVPFSRVAECVTQTRADIDASGLVAPIVGHIGDGNFHVIFVLDPDDADEMARYEQVYDRLIRRALAMGGTCTGEHGVGHGKARYLPLEHGDEAIELMRTIKAAIDPTGIMNPGKIVPAPHPTRIPEEGYV